MIKIELTKHLVTQIKKEFSKAEANKVLDKIDSLQTTPNKGKLLGTVGGLLIKEIKYKKFRFYYVVDGYKLKLFSKQTMIDLLLRFVRMSQKKDQQQTIDQIKEVLRTIGPDGLE